MEVSIEIGRVRRDMAELGYASGEIEAEVARVEGAAKVKRCPHCLGRLVPVSHVQNVLGCPTCRETWLLPTDAKGGS